MERNTLNQELVRYYFDYDHDTGLFSHNKSGFRGVSWCKNGKKWTARFKHNGKYEFLGYFELKEDAYEARLKREKEVFG